MTTPQCSWLYLSLITDVLWHAFTTRPTCWRVNIFCCSIASKHTTNSELPKFGCLNMDMLLNLMLDTLLCLFSAVEKNINTLQKTSWCLAVAVGNIDESNSLNDKPVSICSAEASWQTIPIYERIQQFQSYMIVDLTNSEIVLWILYLLSCLMVFSCLCMFFVTSRSSPDFPLDCPHRQEADQSNSNARPDL